MGIFGSAKARHFSREVVITPPEPQSTRNGIAIVACVKNEVSYIVEWVRFHQAIGVRHFILYDDKSTDGTFDLLKGMMSGSELTVIPWSMHMYFGEPERLLNGQVIAFAHAINNFGGAFDRMAFIDVDEFLLPKNARTLQAALAPSEGFPNVSLPWHMFGHSGHEQRPELPVTRAYTKRVPDPMMRHEHAVNFKCIIDPTQVTKVAVHHFDTRSYGDKTSNDAGVLATYRDRKRPEFYSAQNIQLNHYYSRSREEFRQKIARGWSYDSASSKYRDKAEAIAGYLEDNPREDRSMIDFLDTHAIKLD
jgi:hypothetical protein